MSKRFAVIDLGTNTFNLLIIEKEGDSRNRIHSEKVGVALGMGGINENRISEDAMSRALNTLAGYKSTCTEFHVDEIFCFGTSAIRSADNKEVFQGKVDRELGLEIKVVSGLEEAELIYQGVSSGYDFKEDGLIMDIGGGSTEFVWADSHGVKKAQSFEIGVSRIFQRYSFSDPYTESDIQSVKSYLENGVGAFFDSIQTKTLIGASGSFETFYELVHEKPYPVDTYMELSTAEINEALERVIRSTQAERDQNDLIIPIRKKMAPIAAIKIQWIIRKLGIERIVISPFSLKEGVIQSL